MAKNKKTNKSVVWVPKKGTPTQKPLHIFVSTPTWREFDAGTAVALSNLMQWANFDDTVRISWSMGVGDSLISRARSEQATKFLLGPQHGDILFFIDSDIVFQPEQVIQLASWCKDSEYGIVCGAYPTRGNEMPRLAQRVYPGTAIQVGQPIDKPIEIIYPSTGFIAIRRDVLQAVADTLPICHSGRTSEMYPLFLPMIADHNDGAGPEYLSEDWAFAARARALGFKSYMDTSIILGHVGTRTYYANDIRTNPMGTSYIMMTEGSVDRTDLTGDLAQQLKLGFMEVMQLVQNNNGPSELTEALKTVDTTNREAVEKLYNTDGSWLLANAQYALSPLFWDDSKVGFASSGRILDIASPLGTAALYAVRNKRPTQYFAWPQVCKEFVESRVSRRPGYRMSIVDSVAQATEVDMVYAIGSLNLMTEDLVEEIVKGAAEKLINGGSFYYVAASPEMPRVTSVEYVRQTLDKYMTNTGGIRWIKE